MQKSTELQKLSITGSSIDEQVREATNGAGVDSVIIAGGNLTNTWKEAVASTKAGGTISNVNYLSGADDVLIPRVEWGCGMSNINITNGLCPGGRVRMERLSRLALTNRADQNSWLPTGLKVLKN